MKTIVAGSREITDYNIVEKAIKDSGFDITTVISGKCRGPDTFGEMWAMKNNIPIDPHPANWNKYHRAAGPIRNQEMVDIADALIAVRIPTSRGTNDCIKRAQKKKLKIFIVEVPYNNQPVQSRFVLEDSEFDRAAPLHNNHQ